VRRHDRVYLRPDATFRFACAVTDAALSASVQAWIAAGRPLVAARQPAQASDVLLGLTLPLAQQRQRVGCLVEPAAIAQVQAPLAIGACLQRLPAACAAPLQALEQGIRACGAGIGVYGSLAWEALSGKAYRHADSDIDLICDVRNEHQYRACLDWLAQAAQALPCRLDGEMRFPDGNAVAWRELLNAPDASRELLVKGELTVGLLPLGALLDSFAAEECHV
jgi:phosphoribosyl-dephospho-CoA transferase